MTIMEHNFTATILAVLNQNFRGKGATILESSELLRYINIKTKAANRGLKSRASFGNLYAIYVLIEDYINHGFDTSGNYDDYEGSRYTDLSKRQNELPFGNKLQNHALNHRVNQEFKKYFHESQYPPYY